MTTQYEIGADEVGLGSLAGPLCVAAVMAPVGAPPVAGWGDSKKLSSKKRQAVVEALRQSGYFMVTASISPAAIDSGGVRAALCKAYEQVMADLLLLGLPVAKIVIDGDPMPLSFGDIPTAYLPKGDGIEWRIGAASCLAKEHRDAYMVGLAESHSAYMWEKNKGYGSKQHVAAIEAYGLTEHHRRTFCKRFSVGALQLNTEPELDVLDLFK